MPNLVVIPNNITVHLGLPNDNAENVTVPFIDYIKNVASSELYPTWPENALKANINAIVSVTLNRLFTGWYRAKGYNFDITNSTQLDQAYVLNRGTFNNINALVDETYDQYITKEGTNHPLYALFCDGRVSECEGLLQWGSVELANKGFTPLEILKYYFGDNLSIEKVTLGDFMYRFKGDPLKLGISGTDVLNKQYQLNRISKNFPGIPKIVPIDGYYGKTTEDAVSAFQKTFNLPVTGIIDQTTWFRIYYIFSAVTKLSEVTTEGVSLDVMKEVLSNTLLYGDMRVRVSILQYFLTLLSLYYKTIPQVPITGIYDKDTRTSVLEFQKTVGLPTTGIVDPTTWGKLYDAALGIISKLEPQNVQLPYLRFGGTDLVLGSEFPAVTIMQSMLQYISFSISSIPYIEITGKFDEPTLNAVIAFQKQMNLDPTGIVNENTWNVMEDVYRKQRYGNIGSTEQI